MGGKLIIVIPEFLIETGWARQKVGAWIIERSVFYIHGADWVYLEELSDWTVVIGIN